jgi:ubiquinol-cytochrome c reductase cytochrome b subunit
VSARLPEVEKKAPEIAIKFQHEKEQAERLAARALTLAGQGVPAEGAINLLRHDPRTRGPELFGQHCAVCHTHGDDFKESEQRKATASDLAGFGTEEYVLRLLRNPGHKDFFGRTGRAVMQEAVEKAFSALHLPPEEFAKLNAGEKKVVEEDLAKERQYLKVLAGWLARHPSRLSPDRDSAAFKEGHKTFTERGCATCHAYEGKGGRQGPDLTGYGDAEWVRLMVLAPAHPKRYGVTNTMPAFRDLEGPAGPVVREELSRLKDLLLAQVPGEGRGPKRRRENIEKAHRLAQLTDVERELIIRWLLKDDRVVFGGEQVAK